MSKEEETEVVSGEEEEIQINVEETRARAKQCESEGNYEEATNCYALIVDAVEADEDSLEMAEPLLDYGRTLLLYSQKCFNELGGLIVQKAMNKSLKAKAQQMEASIMSKAKGKVIDETVSDDDDEEEEASADVASNLHAAWEHLETARAIVEQKNGPKELLCRILYYTGQTAMELDDMERAVEDFQGAVAVQLQTEKPNMRFVAELEAMVGISYQYLERPNDASTHFGIAQDVLAQVLKGMKREDDPASYDDLESVRQEMEEKHQESIGPKVDVKGELDGFSSGFQKPLSTSSPVKDLGVFGRGARGAPRMAHANPAATKRKAEGEAETPAEKKTKMMDGFKRHAPLQTHHNMESEAQVLARAEELYQAQPATINESVEYLAAAHQEYPDHPEIFWRYIRTLYDLGDTKPDDKPFRQSLYEKGLEQATLLLQKFPEEWGGHKWYAIMLSSLAEYQSTKDKISNAFKIKEHAVKATELNPKDASSFHLLGRWCYSVSNVSWVERKVASALFATPPTSSFEESLQYFLKAGELFPSVPNSFWTAEAYMQLRNTEKAREWYENALTMTPASEADVKTQNEIKVKLQRFHLQSYYGAEHDQICRMGSYADDLDAHRAEIAKARDPATSGVFSVAHFLSFFSQPLDEISAADDFSLEETLSPADLSVEDLRIRTREEKVKARIKRSLETDAIKATELEEENERKEKLTEQFRKAAESHLISLRQYRDEPLRKGIKTVNYLNVPKYNQPPEDTLPTLIDSKEIILDVSFYHKKGYKLQEFRVLGSQCLTELRDKLNCHIDRMYEGPDTPSGYFFIENTFYNDMRDLRAKAYSNEIIDWVMTEEEGKVPRYAQPGLNHYNTKMMEHTLFRDLSIRVGAPYHYMHQGDCTHNVVFTCLRAAHEQDEQDRNRYPIQMFQNKVKKHKCSICEIHFAKVITINDRLAPENPCYFCDNCFGPLHYDDTGMAVYEDYQVYPYFPE
ncbi:hypothetical protein PROFUN_02713 [Planoprotostelium fungivorum]|uniref:Uncharacterized protein n=1 Tax=Planoprotostelium fungivorum TaxID=1890364 RepID=A0A2P6NVL9_9EUKA|nr:hypothetical protein PROFUN_02713 [Planoprotostelium fungivorum]